MNESEKDLEKTRFYSGSSVILSCTSIGMSTLNIIGDWFPITVGLVMVFVALLEIVFLLWIRYIITK